MTVFSVKRSIALARFPGLIRDAAREFQRLFGLSVVTTFGSASADRRTRSLPSPPVHPLCAKSLRETTRKSPCDAEWKRHLHFAAGKQACRIHICPLGLRCAGLPITFGDELLGLAKCVSGPEIPKERFRSLVGLLESLIARPSQELRILILREEIQTLEGSVNRLERAKRPAGLVRDLSGLPATKDPTDAHSLRVQTLISQVLEYLDKHYVDSELSLVQVARAVKRNEKYVAHLFVDQLGERMRPYITSLRVRRACELLLQTNKTIEQIARDSGFSQGVGFRQSFRRNIGVTASEYRQVFSPGT
jgi:AraC-like DNA-binding protein